MLQGLPYASLCPSSPQLWFVLYNQSLLCLDGNISLPTSARGREIEKGAPLKYRLPSSQGAFSCIPLLFSTRVSKLSTAWLLEDLLTCWSENGLLLEVNTTGCSLTCARHQQSTPACLLVTFRHSRYNIPKVTAATSIVHSVSERTLLKQMR